MKFGIIGYGRFGKLWSNALSPFGEVVIYDKNLNTTLEQATQVDMLFLTVPISQFKACCEEIKPYLNPESLLVDCCSVKMYPVDIMRTIFSEEQNMVGSHPLFGPDSVQATGGLTGHKIVICNIHQDRSRHQKISAPLEALYKKIGLNVIHSTPEIHDQQMATSQSLIHFIGRGLAALSLHSQELSTPDFETLLDLNQMVINDTWQLFLDMQNYNPYAKDLRQRFVQALNKLESEITNAVQQQTQSN